ncbi:MAG: hypothetical protein WCT99_12880 [Bacteroidota bacterium]|jgi:hypothetical protein
MIDPKQFYPEEDHPGRETRNAIWRGISQRLSLSRRSSVFVFDRKSFAYGMAVSIVLIFAIAGMYTTYRQIVEHAQPQEIRTDRAYQSAIHELESAAYSVNTSHGSPEKDQLSVLRKTRLTYLNGAIDELKRELNSHDLSPLKRQRLRELYTLKLTLLQEMLQQGDIEL